MKKITFKHKGQMINYYNKVIKNNNVKNAICGLFFNEKTNEMEYTVVYSI